jgi:hypothetical protein
MNDTDQTVDQVADCATCHGRIEHYAGEPGSAWLTPYWRHPDGPRPHPAKPSVDNIREVAR